MNWDGPILTDSGGFQVFSLANLRKIEEDGVMFQSHIDGSKHYLTPELSIQIQNSLGSDIKMVFDECPPHDADNSYIKKSLELTTRWAKRSKTQWEKLGSNGKLFGIIQGGMNKELRLDSLRQLVDIDFPGYAIGGLSVGESKEMMYEIIEFITQHTLKDKPLYLMGVGEPEDILFAVKHGIEMFDCVIPTRNARNGSLFTFNGKISIKQARYTEDFTPIDENCDCYTCRNFSKAYLRHLYISKELLAYYLNTVS
jgi:queuine tRNA-ribosyltransferase